MVKDIKDLDLKKSYTYADYLTWELGEFVELIKGKIFRMSPAPLRVHQRICNNISSEVSHFLKKEKCQVFDAPFDVRLVKGVKGGNKQITTVVQPDICVICDITKLDDYGCVGAPDLIVEVLSPATKKKDYNEKFNLYEENGVLEYWIADPKSKEVDVYALEDGIYVSKGIFGKSGEVVKSFVFSGLEIIWDDTFRDT